MQNRCIINMLLCATVMYGQSHADVMFEVNGHDVLTLV